MSGGTGYTQGLLIAVGVLFPTLGFLLVCVRFWMRRQRFGLDVGTDDWLILVASLLVIAMGINAVLGTVYGTMGRDNERATARQIFNQNKIDYVQLVIEKPAYGSIKLSVLFWYRRIFRDIDNFGRVNSGVIALIAVWTVAFFGASIFVCGIHPEAAWNPIARRKYHCANEFIILLCFAITDVLTNILIIWMPYPQIRKLRHVSKKAKGLTILFFAIGALDTVVSFVRMIFIVLTQTVPAFQANFHYQQGSAPTFWTVLEVGVGVIAATLPALAPLFRNWRHVSSSRGHRRQSSQLRDHGTRADVHAENLSIS